MYKFVLFLSISTAAFAECNWRDIQKKSDGSFIYPRSCHLAVGKLVLDEKDQTEAIALLKESLKKKEEALSKSKERSEVYKDATEKMEKKVEKIDQLRKTQRWYYFAAGVLTTILIGVPIF